MSLSTALIPILLVMTLRIAPLAMRVAYVLGRLLRRYRLSSRTLPLGDTREHAHRLPATRGRVGKLRRRLRPARAAARRLLGCSRIGPGPTGRSERCMRKSAHGASRLLPDPRPTRVRLRL